MGPAPTVKGVPPTTTTGPPGSTRPVVGWSRGSEEAELRGSGMAISETARKNPRSAAETPANWATSWRRSPRARRRAPTARPGSSGGSRSRQPRSVAPNSLYEPAMVSTLKRRRAAVPAGAPRIACRVRSIDQAQSAGPVRISLTRHSSVLGESGYDRPEGGYVSVPGERRHRAERRLITRQMDEAARQGARVAHFPEGALSGYAGTDFETFTGYDWDALTAPRPRTGTRERARYLVGGRVRAPVQRPSAHRTTACT